MAALLRGGPDAIGFIEPENAEPDALPTQPKDPLRLGKIAMIVWPADTAEVWAENAGASVNEARVWMRGEARPTDSGMLALLMGLMSSLVRP